MSRNWGKYFKQEIKNKGGLGRLYWECAIFERRLLRTVKGLLNYGDPVCELGIGYAVALSIPLSCWGFDVTGIDNDKSAIELGKKISKFMGADIKFIQGDVFNLNHKQDFDLVYSIGMIEHFEDRNKRIEIIRKHALLSNRYVLIIVPTKHAKSIQDDWMPYTKDMLVRECQDAGLEVRQLFCYGDPIPVLDYICPRFLKEIIMDLFTFGQNLAVICEVEE